MGGEGCLCGQAAPQHSAFCRNNPKVKNMQIWGFHSLEQSVMITERLALRGDGKLLAGVSFSVVVVSGF